MSRKRTSVVIAAAALTLLATVLVVWSYVDGSTAGRAHDDALRLWESREPTSYSFDYSACSGMCEPCHARITVVNGEVSDVSADGGCRDLDRDSAPTIETIFAMEEEGRSDPMTDSFEIDYDPQWGFPARVVLHCPPDTTDCGIGYSVTAFRES